LTVLTNSIDMEGDLPEEMTAELQVKIEIEGQEPVVLKDTLSGLMFSGNRGAQALYGQISTLVSLLTNNTFKPLRINRIECTTRLQPGRRTADIEWVELESDTYAPGETLKAAAYLRPYKGVRQRVPLSLKLPADLPEGQYTATVCDDLISLRTQLRENPALLAPQNIEQLLESINVQVAAKRTSLAIRLPIPARGVALRGEALPDLPGSMVQILSAGRRTGAMPITSALTSRSDTGYVVQGMELVRFTVARDKKVLAGP
jgi:hypothetical protein